jgi:hypothetical protein
VYATANIGRLEGGGGRAPHGGNTHQSQKTKNPFSSNNSLLLLKTHLQTLPDQFPKFTEDVSFANFVVRDFI